MQVEVTVQVGPAIRKIKKVRISGASRKAAPDHYKKDTVKVSNNLIFAVQNP